MENLLTEVQEAAFGLVFNIVQNFSVTEAQIKETLDVIHEMISKNLYKCEEMMYGSALQSLFHLL